MLTVNYRSFSYLYIAICFVDGSCFICYAVFIWAYWCPPQCQYQIMFMSYNSNTMGAIKEQKLLTLPELMSLSAIVGGW